MYRYSNGLTSVLPLNLRKLQQLLLHFFSWVFGTEKAAFIQQILN